MFQSTNQLLVVSPIHSWIETDMYIRRPRQTQGGAR